MRFHVPRSIVSLGTYHCESFRVGTSSPGNRLFQNIHACDAKKSVHRAVTKPQNRQDHSGLLSPFKLHSFAVSSKRTDRIFPAFARIAPKHSMLKSPNVVTITRPETVEGAWFPYPTVVITVKKNQAVPSRFALHSAFPVACCSALSKASCRSKAVMLPPDTAAASLKYVSNQ